MKTTVDKLDKEVMKILEAYRNATDEVVDEAVKITAKEAAGELKKANPPGSGKYGKWDKYNASWTVSQTKTDMRYHYKATVHNKKYYRLTHLLEKGHALPQGGRSKAFPHIAPVEAKANEKLLERIRRGL